MKHDVPLLRHIFSTILVLMIIHSCQPLKTQSLHIFYLHGRIVQEQGINARSDQFGKYEYDSILDSLNTIGNADYSVIRNPNTNFEEFCVKTSNQVDSLIEIGVKPQDILVIGASMGGVMAMHISTINTNPINYVLIGSNNNSIEQNNQFDLHGRILGIHEKSDSICDKNYQYWINASDKTLDFKQIEINTKLGHGFVYRPLKDWIFPIKEWMKNKPANDPH